MSPNSNLGCPSVLPFRFAQRVSILRRDPAKETLVGSVERVTFHNEENGFAVLKVKARGQRDLVPVVGTSLRSPPANSSTPSASGSPTAPTACSSRRTS